MSGMSPEELSQDELGRAVAAFVLHLRSERRSSPNTLDAYRRDLVQLVAFVRQGEKRGASLAGVTKLTLRTFLGELAKTRESASVARKLAAIRSFFRYLVRTGKATESPAELIATPRVRRRLPVVLSAESTAEVVESPEDAPFGSEASRLRDAALLEILYGSGLRVSELAGLD